MNLPVEADDKNIFAKAWKKIEQALEDEETPRILLSDESEGKNADVYTEVQFTPGVASDASVKLRLKNGGTLPWPKDMQLVPILSAPTARIFFETKICQLQPGLTSDLEVNLQIPKDYPNNHLIVLLKIKSANRVYVGPTLVLFIQLKNPLKPQNDLLSELKSSFEESNSPSQDL